MERWEKVKKVFSVIEYIIGKTIRFFAKSLFIILIILCVSGTFFAGYVGLKLIPIAEGFKEEAYNKFESINSNTFKHEENTIILDKNRNEIGQINIGNYIYTDIEDVSDWVTKGYIATEDKRFKVHNGIDVKGLLRAGLSLVKNGGSITQGGSTITQQVVKNCLLTQDRTFERKFVEMFLAMDLEKQYSKQDIMEYYVNTCFYGNNCYGIETASLYYFDKDAKDLSLQESAFFVGISNNASYYNPRNRLEDCMRRYKIVLGEMLEEGYITEDEYNKSVNYTFNFAYTREQRGKESYQVSYAIHCATLNLMDKEGFEFQYLFKNADEYNAYREKYSTRYSELSNEIRSGGYILYTSLDSDMQKMAQDILDAALSKYTTTAEDGRFEFQGATVIVNNETGYVEAIIGGRGTNDEFNRGFLARRQPGSTIKPLAVYPVAFETGEYYPSLIMEDKPDKDDKYYPENSGGGYLGNMPIREALGRSINTIAYQIMKAIGPSTGLEFLSKLKFTSLSYDDYENTAVALGGFTYGVTVVDMAKGYSTIANMGNYIDNNCIIRIDHLNETIFNEDSKVIPVYTDDVAYMTIDCAKGVLYEDYGTAKSRKLDNGIAFAKTGTTNDSKDIWFCGSTVYYSCAVWVGYDTPKETRLYGSTLTGDIWQQIMNNIHVDKEVIDFARPSTVIESSVNYKGMPVTYTTGKTDIFSQKVMDSKEDYDKNKDEINKINKDNLTIEDILEEIESLSKYKIKDIGAYEYLYNKFIEIDNDIQAVYQVEKQLELEQKMLKVKKYFEIDMRDMAKYLERQAELEEYSKQIAIKNNVVYGIRNINSFNMSLYGDIESGLTDLDNLYFSIEINLDLIESEKERAEYKGLYTTARTEKEIEYAGYREELRQSKLREKEDEIEHLIDQLNNTYVYDDSVVEVEEQIKELLKEYEKLGGKSDNYLSKMTTAIEKMYVPSEEPEDENNKDNQSDWNNNQNGTGNSWNNNQNNTVTPGNPNGSNNSIVLN